MMQSKCLECEQVFQTERSLHTHIKKHSLSLADYYTKHFPRKNLLTGTLLSFKDKESYFERDFENREQLLRWCEIEKPETVKEQIKKMLANRIKNKDLKYAPCHLELETSEMPSIDLYKKHFGTYSKICDELKINPMFRRSLPKKFHEDYSNVNIFIDTREQQPLTFKNQKSVKLDFGDYTASGTNYTKTFVDRKSESDFKGTLVGENLERFRRELQRCKDMECYLFVVVESSLQRIKNNNDFTPHKANLKFIYHNMRLLQHEFAGYCQFIFSGNRSNSEILIPKLTAIGSILWDVDVQYFLDKDQSWLGSKEIKKENLHFAT
jgi:hypothetical protein